MNLRLPPFSTNELTSQAPSRSSLIVMLACSGCDEPFPRSATPLHVHAPARSLPSAAISEGGPAWAGGTGGTGGGVGLRAAPADAAGAGGALRSALSGAGGLAVAGAAMATTIRLATSFMGPLGG